MDTRSAMRTAVFGFTAIASSIAHAEEYNLKVLVQKKQFLPNEVAEIEIRNQSSGALHFIVYAEVWDKGQWFAWPYRMEDGRANVLPHLRELDAGQGIFVHLQPGIAESPDVSPSGDVLPEPDSLKFRVCTQVELNVEALSGIVDCTEAFEMQFPYGAGPERPASQ